MSGPRTWTIGELARDTGVPARTIRFWSDEGLVPPSGRTTGGYRTYDEAAAGRLELVRTLRELGIDLGSIRGVLARTLTVAQVAAAHADALEAQIRVLRLQRSVLLAVAAARSTEQELKLVHDLARLSASERNRIVEEFVEETFAGLPADGGVASRMRTAMPDLPDDPTPDQVNAWVELATLVQDPGFRARVREMAEAGATSAAAEPTDSGRNGAAAVLEQATAAMAAGIDPRSAEARPVVDRIVAAFGTEGTDRTALAAHLATFTDRRVERYWQLLGTINGWPGWEPQVPAFEWLLAGLEAHR